jgi:hydroxymethylpyrimidine/phosphomethylpyrimidine kinase
LNLALVVAGSDPTGGAGLAADLRTFAALGVYPLLAVSAVTAQDPAGGRATGPVSADSLRAQLASVDATGRPRAAKIGLLSSTESVRELARYLDQHPDLPAVVDPVLGASNGAVLTEPGLVEVLREEILPRATLLTPNHPELEAFLGRAVGSSAEELEAAARELCDLGARALLLKGGHRDGDEVEDLFFSEAGVEVLRAARVGGVPARGTGCVLSSAIAAGLARGRGLEEAVREAKSFLTASLESSFFVGEARMRVLHPFWEYYGSEGLP